MLVRRPDHRYARPWQGLVVDWRQVRPRQGTAQWEALVIFVDDTQDGTPLVQRWFPADQLRPCRTDPNQPRDDPY